MEEHSLDEFLDDPRFITQEQKQIYLTKGKYLSTRSKTAIAKNFEDMYESFKWCGTRKGITYIELGDARDEPRISHDKRHTRQTNEMTKLATQQIINFMNELNPRDEHIHDGYYYTTPFFWLFEVGLLDVRLRKFYNQVLYSTKEQAMDKWLSVDYSDALARDYKEKEYLDQRKSKVGRRLIGQVFNQAMFKMNVQERYVIVTYYTVKPDDGGETKFINNRPRLMTEEEEAKYLAKVDELDKSDEYEKPRPFTEKTDKMIQWELEIKSFLNDELHATQVYKNTGLKIDKYGESKAVDLKRFRELFKDKADRATVSNRFNGAEKYFFGLVQRTNFKDEYEEQRLMSEIKGEPEHILNELDKFDVLDIENGLGVRSKETQEYINERLQQLDEKVQEFIHSRKQDIIEIDSVKFIEEYLERQFA